MTTNGEENTRFARALATGATGLEPATSGVTGVPKRFQRVSPSCRIALVNRVSAASARPRLSPDCTRSFPCRFQAGSAASRTGGRRTRTSLGALRAVGFFARLADQVPATNQFAPSKDHGCDEARAQRPGGVRWQGDGAASEDRHGRTGNRPSSSIPPGAWSSCGRPSSADPLPPDRSTSQRAWQAALQRAVAAEAPPPPVGPAPVVLDGA